MRLPIGVMLVLTIILFVGACETMPPTKGASRPAENDTSDAGLSGGNSSGGGMGSGDGSGGGY
jgi:hypothetical protein